MSVETGGGPNEDDSNLKQPDVYEPKDMMSQVVENKFGREQIEDAKGKISELEDREWVVIQDPEVFKELRKDFEGWPLDANEAARCGAVTGKYGAWFGSPDRSIYFNDESGELRVYRLESVKIDSK